MKSPLRIVELHGTIESDFVKEYFRPRKGKLNVLEAGCGQRWMLDLGEFEYTLTGLDISPEALEIRQSKEQDLDHAIAGDLEEIELGEGEYDLIYNSYVLEHLMKAPEVLEKFFQWLKPGGLLVLIIPDRSTVKGFVTRVTPTWFHVLYYRHVVGYKHAGKPGHLPFPTFYRPIVSRDGIHNYCAAHGHKVHIEYGVSGVRGRGGVLAGLVGVATRIIQLASFGRLRADYSDIVYVLEKVGKSTVPAGEG